MTKTRKTNTDPHEQVRRQLRAFWEREPALLAQLRATMSDPTVAAEPPLLPPGYQHLTCGARTRLGPPCQSQQLWPPSYRCKFHGGLSARVHDARTRARESAASGANDDQVEGEAG